MDLLGDVGHVECHLFLVGDCVSVGGRYNMVCGRRTIGSEIVLDRPDGTTSNEAQVETHFGPFGDSANFGAR